MNNLTNRERERLAYIAGDLAQAEIFGALADEESMPPEIAEEDVWDAREEGEAEGRSEEIAKIRNLLADEGMTLEKLREEYA